MEVCFKPCDIDSTRAPAMIDSTSASLRSFPHKSRNTKRSICGFTDKITMSALFAAFRLSLVVPMPNRFSRSCTRSACGSLAVIALASTACELNRPPIIAPAIAPPPMNAIDLPASAFATRFSAMFVTFSILLSTFYLLLSTFYSLGPYLPRPFDDPLICGQLAQSHRPARVKLLRRDAHLGSQPELAAIGELRAGVDEHRRGIDFVQEPLRRLCVSGDDRFGMARAMRANVVERFVQAAD